MPGVGWKKLITEERITADIHRPVGWYTIAVSLVSINASARFGLNNVFAEGIGNVTFYATTTSTSESQINIISKSGKGSFPVENIRIKTDPDGTGAALQFYNNSEDNRFSLILFGDNEGNGVGNWELIDFLPDNDNPGEDYNLNNTQWSNFNVSTIIDANTVNLGLSTTGNVTSAHVSASRLLINDELNPHIFSVGLDAGLGFLPEVHIGGTEAGTKTLISSPENGVFSSFGSNYPTIGLQFDPGPTPNVYIGNNDHYLGLAYLTDGTPEIQIKGESIKLEGPITHVGGLTTDSIVLSTNTAGTTSDEIVVRDSSGNLKTISNIGDGSGLTNVCGKKVYLATTTNQADFPIPFQFGTTTAAGCMDLAKDSANSFTYNPSLNTLKVPRISTDTISVADDTTFDSEITFGGEVIFDSGVTFDNPTTFNDTISTQTITATTISSTTINTKVLRYQEFSADWSTATQKRYLPLSNASVSETATTNQYYSRYIFTDDVAVSDVKIEMRMERSMNFKLEVLHHPLGGTLSSGFNQFNSDGFVYNNSNVFEHVLDNGPADGFNKGDFLYIAIAPIGSGTSNSPGEVNGHLIICYDNEQTLTPGTNTAPNPNPVASDKE